MTALSKYQRLEASAIWRDSISGQRRDVIVSLGDASLVITDKNERPLTHWFPCLGATHKSRGTASRVSPRW